MLHGFIHIEQKKQTSKPKKKVSAVIVNHSAEEKGGGLSSSEFTIADLVSVARDEDMDIVQLLKEHITVMEVAV